MSENHQTWLDAFLGRRNLEQPDGRPLYAYLCRIEEFEALGTLLLSDRMTITLYLAGSLHSPLPTLDRLFVLFCAEWWRRHYASGPWKWQPIFNALNWPEIDQATRSRFVERGLRYWKRPLLRRGDDRGFLLTVACEGGFPVNLIRNDTGYLRAFLRAILRDYANYASAGVDAAEFASIHLNYLPVTLRQPMLQELAGILIKSIWELQTQITQVDNPIAELDGLDQNWRQRLPIAIEDHAANALVSALLQQAKKIRTGVANRLRIARRLIRIGENWELHAELLLPDTINQKLLIEELGARSSLGERLEMQMVWGKKVVRVASLVQQGDSYNVYPHDRRHLQIRENATTTISCLIYERGQRVGGLPLPGGSALTDELPLVFVDREGGGQVLEFVGQGSLSSRFSEVYVLAHVKPENLDANSNGNESALITERLEMFDREASLYRASGEFNIKLDEAVTCVIRTRQKEESGADYRFEGRQDYLCEAKWPVFIGVPRLKRVYENGSANYVNAEELYWSKTTGKRIWWKVTAAKPRGLVDFRHIQNGEGLYACSVIVLPENAEIKLVPSDKNNEGVIALGNLQTSLVSWQQQEGLDIKKSVEDRTIFLQCSAKKSTIGKINLKLAWSDGCDCDLVIPFPTEGGRFVNPDGKIVPASEYLALDDLCGYSAVAVSLRGGQRFYVQGKLKAHDVDVKVQRALDFKVSLSEVTGRVGIFDLPLYELYHKLLQLFNQSSDKDAIVTLELMRHGCIEARIDIRQFSASIKFDAGSKKLHIVPKIEEMVLILNQESIELLPLKDTEVSSLWLKVQEDENPSWPVSPEILEQGPWLAAISKGACRRYRPRFVPPLSQTSSLLLADAGLCKIIAEPDYETRILAMHALFEKMEGDLNHQEWPVLIGYVERFATVHPNCLDWIAVAIEHPRLLIGLLLIGGAHIFETIYEWQEHLPFKWWMLSIKDWQTVIQAHLKPFENDPDTHRILAEEIARSLYKLNERNNAFGIILEFVAAEILKITPATRVLVEIKTCGIDKSWDHLQRFFSHTLLREKADAQWLIGIDREEWIELMLPEHRSALRWMNASHDYQRAVLDAPLAAAYFSIIGKHPQKIHRSFLTAFRDFHPDWFDTAFRAAQAILLVQFERGNSGESSPSN